MFTVTDAAGFKIYFTSHSRSAAEVFAAANGLRVVEVVFCNDHNSLYH